MKKLAALCIALTLIVKSFKGAKPEGAPNAYDARSVMKYLGPQLGIEQGK